MADERLQKVLASAGFGSRRACEALIAAGRVTVGGQAVLQPGTKVDLSRVEVCVDGQPIDAERLRYIMLHKPAGYLSNPDRRAGYPSWVELVNVPERLFAVGRLDVDSEGLLLLTNDGGLANRLIHPRYEHPKSYLLQVTGIPNARKLRRMEHGVMLEDGPTAPAQVALLRGVPAPFAQPRPPEAEAGRPAASTWLRVTVHEGRKRQLRRMVGLLGHPALRVIRVGLGPLELGELAPGKWRELTPAEVRALRDAVERGDAAGDSARVRAAGVPVARGAKQIAPGGAAEGAGEARAEAAAAARESAKEPASEHRPPRIIAIDGPAASGKSTVGALLAHELGYLYFDTGIMYRAVAALALARGISIADEPAVTALAERVVLEVRPPAAGGRDTTLLADGVDITPELRKPEVERAVSPVSAYAGVRRAMTDQQRRIGRGGQLVVVGRDIGTVVFPDADLKIYLEATLAERAKRRFKERQERGETADYDGVLEDMRRRDRIDSSRRHAPLSAAPDAIVIDSTDLTIPEVVEKVRMLIGTSKGRRKR